MSDIVNCSLFANCNPHDLSRVNSHSGFLRPPPSFIHLEVKSGKIIKISTSGWTKALYSNEYSIFDCFLLWLFRSANANANVQCKSFSFYPTESFLSISSPHFSCMCFLSLFHLFISGFATHTPISNEFVELVCLRHQHIFRAWICGARVILFFSLSLSLDCKLNSLFCC